MNIMVFLHGTAIMHRNAVGRTRQESVQQVHEQEASVRDYANYVSIGNVVQKLGTWMAQGAVLGSQ